ncbi:MAG: thioredoxin family protein [Limnohabitans sp.]|jgi:thioredoxin 1|uniref:thioredoxin family protein n=1 Tax=Limnohabitans sp. TaxID=1907725 RepID=UPI00391D1775
MSTFKPYLSAIEAPSQADVQAMQGLTLLEFGTEWCGHCRAAQPLIAQALAAQPHWQHCKVEDGPGRPLGRSYRVKLWPTLVLLRDGHEVGRMVRPSATAISAALAASSPSTGV